MLMSYSLLAVSGWLLVVLLFLMSHAPERSMSEIIREIR